MSTLYLICFFACNIGRYFLKSKTIEFMQNMNRSRLSHCASWQLSCMIIKLPRYGGVFFCWWWWHNALSVTKNNPFVVVVVWGCVPYYNVWIISNLAESNVFDLQVTWTLFNLFAEILSQVFTYFRFVTGAVNTTVLLQRSKYTTFIAWIS